MNKNKSKFLNGPGFHSGNRLTNLSLILLKPASLDSIMRTEVCTTLGYSAKPIISHPVNVLFLFSPIQFPPPFHCTFDDDEMQIK
jgi:hypothetical protein